MEREPNEADTVGRILREASQLFVERGYQGVSMREIGEAAGITKAGLYYHFKDKQDLFMAVLGASLDEIGAILDQAEKAEEGARGRIAAAMRGLLAMPAERRALIRVASQEMVHISPDVRAAFNEVYQQKFVGRVAQMLEQGMRRGELKPIEPQLATWLLLGMAYPFFDPGHSDAFGPDAADMLLDVFFEGLQSQK